MAKDWKEYERTIAKALSAWWGFEFRRTPSSGAWSTQGRVFAGKPVASNDFHGDIVAPPEAHFPFSVECKCYQTVDLYLALYSREGVLFNWWEQSMHDAQRVKKWPMLVFKGNNKKPLVAVSGKLWAALEVPDSGKTLMRLTWMNGTVRREMAIMELQAFLSTVKACRLRAALSH